MTARRSFFKRAAAIVACLAIAPEIAFRAKLPLPDLDWKPNVKGVYEQLMECESMGPSSEPLDLQELIASCYRLKHSLENPA